MEPTNSDPENIAKAPPMRSVHTVSFAEILHGLGLSLAVTTYQAGKLVLLRPEVRVMVHFGR